MKAKEILPIKIEMLDNVFGLGMLDAVEKIIIMLKWFRFSVLTIIDIILGLINYFGGD